MYSSVVGKKLSAFARLRCSRSHYSGVQVEGMCVVMMSF
jgi:hypothetical protein